LKTQKEELRTRRETETKTRIKILGHKTSEKREAPLKDSIGMKVRHYLNKRVPETVILD